MEVSEKRFSKVNSKFAEDYDKLMKNATEDDKAYVFYKASNSLSLSGTANVIQWFEEDGISVSAVAAAPAAGGAAPADSAPSLKIKIAEVSQKMGFIKAYRKAAADGLLEGVSSDISLMDAKKKAEEGSFELEAKNENALKDLKAALEGLCKIN